MNPTAGKPPHGARGHLPWARVLAAALLGMVCLADSTVLPPKEEFLLKAQTLVELTPYFTWPEPRDPASTFTIAVVGKSPFGTHLDAYARRRTIHGRRIEVHYPRKPADIPPCDLVFICRSERRRAPEILEWARGKGVLTVTDDEDLLKLGVMVDMVVEGGLLRLYVNPQVATAERFSVSSQLLRLARLIESR